MINFWLGASLALNIMQGIIFWAMLWAWARAEKEWKDKNDNDR